jgi:hypothetical protein
MLVMDCESGDRHTLGVMHLHAPIRSSDGCGTAVIAYIEGWVMVMGWGWVMLVGLGLQEYVRHTALGAVAQQSVSIVSMSL